MIEYITNKINNYTRGFKTSPNIMIISKEHYELVKDETIIKSLEVVIDEVKNPIIFKK